MQQKVVIVVASILLGLMLAGASLAQQPLQFTDVGGETGMWDVRTAWGVTAVDVDNDGDIDLCMANNGSENALFYNEGGLKFRGRPIIGGPRGTEALTPGDIDGDGNLDLLSCAWGAPLALLKGSGDGRFTDITGDSGLALIADGKCGGASLGDLDGDGDPDLHVPDGSKGDRLYANEEGLFEDITPATGVPEVAQSESSVMADFNGDGKLDIYVPRYSGGSALYLNAGDWSFEDMSVATEAFSPVAQIGSCAFDADGDGDLDLLLIRGRFSDEPEANVLLINEGDGEFPEFTPVEWPEQPLHNHSASVGDVDNDGDLDVLTSAPEGCALWLNDGKGEFTKAGEGMLWNELPGAGAVLCDLDEDGDLDILIRARPTEDLPIAGEFLFRNDLNDDNWLKVRPVSNTGSRFCQGAQVRVYEAGGIGDADRRIARRDITSHCGWGSYLPFYAHFGLDAARAYDVEVRFTDGSHGAAAGVKPGRAIEVEGQ